MSRTHVLRSVAVIIVAVVVAGALAFDTAKVSSLTSSQTTLATQALAQSRQARGFASDIAAQRHQTILRQCREQNARHNHTIRVLNRILRKAERASPPPRRAQIRESRSSTVLLIDQLAPHRNCRHQLALDNKTTK